LLVNVGEERGLEETPATPNRRALATRDEASASPGCIGDQRLQLRRVMGLGDGSERGGRVERVAESVAADQRLARFYEATVDRSVHVDALDGAAALTGVVDRAVDDVVDGLLKIAVGRDVGRVVASELEAGVQKATGRRSDDAMAA